MYPVKKMSFESRHTELRYVLYIDILGFSEKVIEEDGFHSESGIKSFFVKLNELYRGNGGITQINNRTHIGKLTFSFFSDSVLASLPCYAAESTHSNNPTKLTLLFDTALDIQRLSVSYLGLPVRGAICVGTAYHNEDSNMVFGSAVAKAVKLEKYDAKFPRIIVDESVIRSWTYKTENMHLDQDDDDEKIYIAPFLHYCYEKPENNPPYIDMINKGLQHSCKKVKEKYHWLAKKYHHEAKRQMRNNPSIKTTNFDCYYNP